MTTSQVEKLPNDVEKPPEGCVSRVRLRDPQELQCKQKKKKKTPRRDRSAHQRHQYMTNNWSPRPLM